MCTGSAPIWTTGVRIDSPVVGVWTPTVSSYLLGDGDTAADNRSANNSLSQRGAAAPIHLLGNKASPTRRLFPSQSSQPIFSTPHPLISEHQ